MGTELPADEAANRSRSFRAFLRGLRRVAPGRSGGEVMRCRKGGGWGAAGYVFPGPVCEWAAFFETSSMQDYSEAVVIEGDLPTDCVDLSVFVGSAPAPGASMLRRAMVKPAPREPHLTEELLESLGSPEAFVSFLSRDFPGAALKPKRELLESIEELRLETKDALGAVEASRSALVERWVLADGYSGLERAGLMVLDVRGDESSDDLARIAGEVGRLRTDPEVYRDVLGGCGSRKPVTVVVADLADPRDPGLRKALARARRAVAEVRRPNSPH